MIKKYSLIVSILLISFKLYSMDISSPTNGNLYITKSNIMDFRNLRTYKSINNLNLDYITIYNNRLIDKELILTNTNKKYNNISKGSNIAYFENDISVILTGNSTIYPHGILGDSIESTGFIVYKKDEVIGVFNLEKGDVFETLRPLIAEIVPENEGPEIILTSSNKKEGAKINVYSLTGKYLGSSKPIGQGFRWLHVLGVAPLGSLNTNRIIIVQTPHIGGILKSLKWVKGSLEVEKTLPGVSTHKIGSDNLNMALLLDDGIIVPKNNFKSILFISKDFKILNEFELNGLVKSNIFYDSKSNSIFIELDTGEIVRFTRN